ncbi:right-handed parallel beta-helix repeat-containing protein [Chitinophagaceae bacterium 26-R-25]|nr:right-handed parallel beta-helix repeat-containing protein [Chitinophagaceae bacterium 26-R-25]
MLIKPIQFLVVTFLLLACGKKVTSSSDTNTSGAYTYYVSTNGNDANVGSLNEPFKSISTALEKAKAGDTIFVREGVYQEKVAFRKSGRLDKLITLKAYPDERPVIDGSSFSVTGKDALVTISNISYVSIEGFDICNFRSSTPQANVNGIVVDQGSKNITIRKNRIYNIEHNVKPEEGRSGHGIEILGNTDVAMKDILVEENEIHDCNTGYSENLTINGYVDGFTIRKNKIYNAENIGIDAAGGYAANANPSYNYARNGVISENELYNIDMTTGPIGNLLGHGAIAIYVDGARNITVERNKIHDTDRGIGIVSENNAFPTENCIVRNNFVYNCFLTGIYLGGYLGYTTGGTINCHVVNNTLLFNNRILGHFGEVEGEIRLTENCTNNVIKNNIIYASPTNDVFIHKYTATGSGNVIDNNLYFSTGTAKWIWQDQSGTTTGGYTNFNAWKTASACDVSSINGIDPLLVNTNAPAFDLHIQPLSPAKNTGTVISSDINGSTDIDRNPRIVNNKISKGAQQ